VNGFLTPTEHCQKMHDLGSEKVGQISMPPVPCVITSPAARVAPPLKETTFPLITELAPILTGPCDRITPITVAADPITTELANQ